MCRKCGGDRTNPLLLSLIKNIGAQTGTFHLQITCSKAKRNVLFSRIMIAELRFLLKY